MNRILCLAVVLILSWNPAGRSDFVRRLLGRQENSHPGSRAAGTTSPSMKPRAVYTSPTERRWRCSTSTR